ncbi:MAG: rhodanese-like domain-containing protein [Rhizomicrobium sp.]
MTIEDLDPKDVARWMAERSVILIDVREPTEYAAERIHGALLYPLSTFDPHALPDPEDKKIVFHCGSGVRSAKAIERCRNAGLAYNSHMKGGIQAWKAAGLPTMCVDPTTGQMR